MNIVLICTTFNSLTQAIYVELKDRGYKIKVLYAVDMDMVAKLNPDIILSPFLKEYLPSSIYENYPTFILHPGPIGDRGAYSLEYALEQKEWGVVWLKATRGLDEGDIYAEVKFNVRDTYKASLYRQEVLNSAVAGIDGVFKDSCKKQILNSLHKPFTEDMRKINWQKDDTDTIIKKIYQADSDPGVKDEILGVECYLFGVWREERLKGEPKEILAKRDGAICLATVDGAVWITHLKEPDRFKLPATYVLKERLKGVKEDRLPLLFDKSYDTFYEISVEIKDEVAYLCFNFRNGAFSSACCIRLKYAVDYLKNRCKVLVLVGGEDFFSNGIDLNILEDSQKQEEDGWENINAMNDLISSILFADEIVTVASLARNAGAGGVFMALACDFVIAKDGVVLNPHYKTLALSGSEYHTYTLPKRVGKEMADKLLDDALPISVKYAKKIGLIDEVFLHDSYYKELHQFSKESYSDDFIWQKQEYLEKNRDKIEALKEEELKVMHPEFWDKKSSFHKRRREFVYKICPASTPKRFM